MAALLSSNDPILAEVRHLNNTLSLASLSEDNPNIQPHPQALEHEISPNHNPLNYSDHSAFDTMFGAEMETKSTLEQLLDEGSHFVQMLYTFRSVSRAIPMITDQNATNKKEMNWAAYNVLRPEVVKLKKLMEFQESVIRTFCMNIQQLVTPEARKKVVPEGLYDALIKVVDLLQKLDNLKDMKACLLNDFSRYKRAFNSIRSELKDGDAQSEEIHQLHLFLGNPAYPKQLMFYTLRDAVKKIPGHEQVLCEMIEQCADFLEQENYLTPDEKYRLIRAMPHLMLLADGEADASKSFNIFKNKLVNVDRLKRLFKRYPYVPEVGDMSITVNYILQRAPHYNPESMDSAWGGGEVSNKVKDDYLLHTHWKDFRENHLAWTANFTSAVGILNEAKFEKEAKHAAFCGDVYHIVLSGLRLIRDMTCAVIEQSTWKLTHPCTDQDLDRIFKKAKKAEKDKKDETNYGNEYSEVSDYERVVRYNYTPSELSVLVDTISMIKSSASLLKSTEAKLAPVLRLYIHNEIQNLVQRDMIEILHRADKKKRAVMTSLMQIRTLAIDWLRGQRHDDYRTWKKNQPPPECPARVVAAGPTQLHLMRVQIRALYDEKSAARASAGIFSKRDLTDAEAKVFEEFYYVSLNFSYLLAFGDTINTISDLGDLWYREFHLEMTKQIQFPIAMSFPWILMQHVINNQKSDTPLIEDLAYTMDVYNDTAQRSLHHFDSQYLYDEIQAEVNLVFDQLIFAISDETYTYYKDFAASNVFDGELKKVLEKAKNYNYLTKRVMRQSVPISQKHIQLLGRSVDLNLLITQHVSNKFYHDIELCLQRFEGNDLSIVMEFQRLLKVLKATHKALVSSGIRLDSFDSMLDAANESVGATNDKGRMAMHTLRSLVTDLFPNYSYNIYTQRFVRSPTVYRPTERSTTSTKHLGGNMGYGALCSKSFEHTVDKSQRGFFGGPHISAVIEVLGKHCLPLIIEECLNNLEERLVDLKSYAEALKEGLPPIKLPKYMFRTGGVYGFFEGKLKVFLEYEALKPEVFQNFREIGNTLFFLRDLSDLIDLNDSYAFVNAAPFVGVDCPTKERPTGNRCSSMSVYNPKDDSPLQHLLHEELNVHSNADDLESVFKGAQSVHSKDCQGISSVFKTAIEHVTSVVTSLGIAKEWATSEPQNGIPIEISEPNDFYRLFSALNFLFCVHEEDPVVDEEIELANSSGMTVDELSLTDEEEFGHGFGFAGVLLMHILKQRPSFEMLDFSYHCLNVQLHEKCAREMAGGAIGMVDEEMQAQANRFLVQAQRQRDIHRKLFSTLEANNVVDEVESIVTFQPPATDVGLGVKRALPKGSSAINLGGGSVASGTGGSKKNLNVEDIKLKDIVEAPEAPALPPPSLSKSAPPPPPRKESDRGAPPPPQRPADSSSGKPPVPPAKLAPPAPPKRASVTETAVAPPVPKAAPPAPPKRASVTETAVAPPVPKAAPPAPPKRASVTETAVAPPVPRAAPPAPPKRASVTETAVAPPVPRAAPPAPPKRASVTETAVAPPVPKAAPPPPPPSKKVGSMLPQSGTKLPEGIGKAPPPPPPPRP